MITDQPVIRIGVADDHTMFRRGIISLLSEISHFSVVAEAPNGQVLADAIARLKEPPDVCILDINMPELNGYDTIRLLKETYPGMKFLILSMLEHELIVIKMLRLGANGYLLKEDDPGQLKRAIETVYAKDFYHTDLVNGHLISLARSGDEYRKVILSDHELKFLEYSCSEMTYKEIASLMQVSARTVEGYRDQLFDKLDIKSRTGLAIYALRLGLATLD